MLVAAVVFIIDVVEVIVVVVQVVVVVYWSVLQVRGAGCCYVLLWTMTARRVMKRRTIEGWVM